MERKRLTYADLIEAKKRIDEMPYVGSEMILNHVKCLLDAEKEVRVYFIDGKGIADISDLDGTNEIKVNEKRLSNFTSLV